jgi:hypothetical protein
MGPHEYEYEEYGERYMEVNNELIVPEYNRFLEKHNIDFSVLDCLPEKGARRTVIELEYHKRCLNLFNKARKRFYFYRGKVISFWYVTEADFQFDEWDVEEFLEDAGKAVDEIDVLKSQLKINNYILASLALISAVIIPVSVFNMFFLEQYRNVFVLAILSSSGILTALVMERVLSNYFRNRKERLISKELLKIRTDMMKAL